MLRLSNWLAEGGGGGVEGLSAFKNLYREFLETAIAFGVKSIPSSKV